MRRGCFLRGSILILLDIIERRGRAGLAAMTRVTVRCAVEFESAAITVATLLL